MKLFFSVLSILFISISFSQSENAHTVKKTFSRETSIEKDIHASDSIIWSLLTDAKGYSKWNTTIFYIDGEINLREKIRIITTLDSNRMFKLKIKEFENKKRLVWGDGKGNRVYTIESLDFLTTKFTMNEKISGLMFPMYAKYIPSFDESFEQFVSDLTNEAERIQNQLDILALEKLTKEFVEDLSKKVVVNEVGIIDVDLVEFPSEKSKTEQFIDDNIDYSRLDKSVHGTIYVRYNLAQDGSITDVEIIKSLNPAFDKEVLRVMKIIPKWKSLPLAGQKFPISYTLPVKF